MKRYAFYLDGTMGTNSWRDRILFELKRRDIKTDAVFNPLGRRDATETLEEIRREAATVVIHVGTHRDLPDVDASALSKAIFGAAREPSRTVIVFDREGIGGTRGQNFSEAIEHIKSRFPKAVYLEGLDKAIEYIARRLTD